MLTLDFIPNEQHFGESATFGGYPLSGCAGLPPKGETTHYILRVADAPSKCVRCASTGKRLTWFSGRFAPLRTKFACHS